MEKEEKCEKNWGKKKWHKHGGGAFGGGFYFLAFLGTAVYYVQQADGFWMGVLGILKAIIWPAMLIYKVFTLLHM